MDIRNIALIAFGSFLLVAVGVITYLNEENINLNKKLVVEQANRAQLETSLERQNQAIQNLKADYRNLNSEKIRIENTYHELEKNLENRDTLVKEYMEKYNVSINEAKCKTNINLIEKALDEFYKK